MRRLNGLVIGSAVAVAVSLVAAPALAADAPSEGGRPAAQQQPGASFAGDLSYGCLIKRRKDEVKVRCDEAESTSLLFDFTVPKNSLDFRVRAAVTTVATTDHSVISTSGVRLNATTFQAAFNTYGPGTYVIRSVRIAYEVARSYDHRPCVTGGEWALVDPRRGGNAELLGQVTDIFDTRGTRTELLTDLRDGTKYQVRVYPRCGSSKTREVVYVRYQSDGPWQTHWTGDHLLLPDA
jgi:hypothetical protein